MPMVKGAAEASAQRWEQSESPVRVVARVTRCLLALTSPSPSSSIWSRRRWTSFSSRTRKLPQLRQSEIRQAALHREAGLHGKERTSVDFEDPTIKRISQGALVVLMLLLLGIAGLTAWLVVDWDGQINQSELLVGAIETLPNLTGERTSDVQNLTAILLAALPLMIAPVCFSMVGEKRRLNRFGGMMVFIMLVALVLAVVGYLGINLAWQDGHALGLEGLVLAQQWARAVLTACVFYLAALLGIRAKP